jgi:hypothetical protein
VYLLRVVVLTPHKLPPKAKIAAVALPAADPASDAEDDAVADELTHPEKVYLFRQVELAPKEALYPNANMPIVPVGKIGFTPELAALNADGPYALLALTVNV